MKVDFKVHGISRTSANVQAKDDDGEAMTASVPCVEVELTTVIGRNGSLQLRYIGAQMEEAEKFFKKDAVLTAEFSPKAGATNG